MYSSSRSGNALHAKFPAILNNTCYTCFLGLGLVVNGASFWSWVDFDWQRLPGMAVFPESCLKWHWC